MTDQLDNIVKFPTSAQTSDECNGCDKCDEHRSPDRLSPEEISKKSVESQNNIIRLIARNRKTGIEQLQNKLESLGKRDLFDTPLLENTIRELTIGMDGTLVHLEALNTLVDMLLSDMGILYRQNRELDKALAHTTMMMQALFETLGRKEVLTEKDLETTLNELFPPTDEK